MGSSRRAARDGELGEGSREAREEKVAVRSGAARETQEDLAANQLLITGFDSKVLGQITGLESPLNQSKVVSEATRRVFKRPNQEEREKR